MASNVVSRRFSLEPTQRKTKPYHSCNSCSISATPFLHTGSSAQVLADGWARHIGKKMPCHQKSAKCDPSPSGEHDDDDRKIDSELSIEKEEGVCATSEP